MTIKDIMRAVRQKFTLKWVTRRNSLESDGPDADAFMEGYRRGYWEGVVDSVEVGTDVGIIPAPQEFPN